MMELKDVKAGDEVYYLWQRTWSNNIYRKMKVEKVTPKGFIKVNGKLFSQRGYERTSSWHNQGVILPINDKTTDMVKQEIKEDKIKRISVLLCNYDFKKLPEDLIEAIHKIITDYEKQKKDSEVKST